jgi:hypothetical protein
MGNRERAVSGELKGVVLCWIIGLGIAAMYVQAYGYAAPSWWH